MSLNNVPIPQKGQGIEVKVNKGHPLADFIPISINKYSKGVETTKINPIAIIPAIVNNIFPGSLPDIDLIEKYLLTSIL